MEFIQSYNEGKRLIVDILTRINMISVGAMGNSRSCNFVIRRLFMMFVFQLAIMK